MRVAGTINYNDSEYIIMINYSKNITYYYLLSKYHKEDLPNVAFGSGNIRHPIRNLIDYTKYPVDNNYLIGCIKRNVVSGEMFSYGGTDILTDVIERLRFMVTYSFKNSDIISNYPPSVDSQGRVVKKFVAKDFKYSVDYCRIGGDLASVSFIGGDIDIKFAESTHRFPNVRTISGLLQTMKVPKKSRLYYSALRTIDYETVIKSMNHDWFFTYDENGNVVYHKDYMDIDSIESFERHVIDEMVEELKLCRAENRLPMVVALDTETDGLDVFDIPKNLQSTVVAIPFSFKDNSARLIYTDMECFSNVPIEYVRDRLSPFLAKNLLNDDEIVIETSTGPFKFRRSEIALVGHNVMFDIRACLVHGIIVYFDFDTVQLSFNLDPFITKGHNSLKEISHFLFHHETKELSEILGKGNEDKFRNLVDRRLAILYGCADSDYSRKVFFALYDIYKQCIAFHRKDLFEVYKQQDVLLMNVCASMDFEGMRINRDMFVQKGEQVLADIGIITDFAHKYVGRVLAINNVLQQRVEIENSYFSLFVSKGIPDNVARVEASRIAKEKVPDPDLSLESCKPYEFKFSGKSLINVLYKDLNYPALVRTSSETENGGQPAINKTAMKKLMSKKHDPVKYGTLSEDILSTNGKVLIEASEFNKYKYPVSYLVSLVGPRKKEYEAYFKPFIEDSFGDRICKNTSFSRIDTRRISNPIQTIKGDLKQYMLPYSDEYAMCDFDMSQVELRIMSSLAQDINMIGRMRNPESDSHVETAAVMFDKLAYLITAYERKQAKSVSFGYPYGLGDYSLCEQLFGDITEEHLLITRKMLATFEKARHIVVEFLNNVRDNTLKPVGSCEEEPIPVPECLRSYLRIEEDIPIGIVRNLRGFYKLFKLDELDKKKAGRIRRQAGNFPIQSFAAELFRLILIRFYMACERKGWNQKKWIKWHMLIHDELLFSFKKGDIHPIELYEVLTENCVVTFPGHTNYYIGINIGNSWGDCKEDSSEAPVHMVSRLVARWKEGEFKNERVTDPKSYIDKKRQEYIITRVGEVVQQIVGESTSFSSKYITDNFTNYTVRKYVFECFKPLWSPAIDSKSGEPQESDLFDSCFCRWILSYYDKDIEFITSADKQIILTKDLDSRYKLDTGGKKVPLTFGELFEGCEIVVPAPTISLDLEDDSENYYKEIDWDLDSSSNPYYIDYSQDNFDDSDAYDTVFDETRGNTLESMRRVSGPVFNFIQVFPTSNKIYLDLGQKKNIVQLEQFLNSNSLNRTTGMKMIYRTFSAVSFGGFVDRSDLPTIDEFITNLRR